MNNAHTKSHLDIDLFHRMDINLYPLFLAIYEQGSISKAAQLLHISQSAVSHALQKLREYLQDDLFIRANKKMCPTPFSEQIYPDIRAALITIQKVSKQRQIFEINSIKNLKIAIHDEIEAMVFPKLVQHFQKFNLDLHFVSSKLDRKTFISDLASQQIDFVIDLERHVDQHIIFTPLMQDHFMVCSQHQYMDQKIYFSSPHIGVSSRRIGMLVEDVFLSKKKFSREIFLRCQHYSTALQILEQYPNAILTIPHYILGHSSVSKSLNIFPTPIDFPILNIGMYWFNAMEDNFRHQFLRNEILKIFA